MHNVRDHGLLDLLVLSPPGSPDARLPIAAARAGALGVLDLQLTTDVPAALAAARSLAEHGRGRHGFLVDADPAFLDTLLSAAPVPPDAVVLAPFRHTDVEAALRRAQAAGARVLVVASSLEDALAAEAAGADAIVAKGHEAGGAIGEESTFVLVQRLRAEVGVPVWAHGGVGLHTVAACLVAGCEGAVLDAQVLLARESPLPEPVRARIAGLDGSETASLGADLGAPFRVHLRPDLAPAVALQEAERQATDAGAWREKVATCVDWRSLDGSVLAVGQDACFAKSLASRFVTVAGILDALRTAAVEQCRSSARTVPLGPGAPLAMSHGTRYPVVQGPMTRVSDRAAFAEAVADGGGLPFLALALMRAPEAEALLAETKTLLGDKPWGVGILGFVPPELREEQLGAIRKHRPPFALIAGGRPAQAKAMEEDGTATYLHVPSPGLLELYLREGARRFVFEGRECGGHVGPRTSFVLWDTMVRTLLEAAPPGDASEFHVLFAGGVHDDLSAAMTAAIAAPLAERGMRVGCLAGTAYLFTEEAVEAGAITRGFQEAAQACDRTVFLESGPGHATRCLPSPFTDEFADEKRRLIRDGAAAPDVRMALEELNIGRLRIASKGLDRAGSELVGVGPEDQWRRGMYMIGQVAALHAGVRTIAGLHAELSDGAARRLAGLALPGDVAEPAPEPADIAIVGMGCILPGAPDVETFWANVINGVDAVTEVPPDRFDWRAYFDADRTKRDKVYSRWGGFIPDVPFDPVAFGMPPNSLRSIDPFQILGLMTAQAALKDAGYDERPFPRERTSVVLGAGGGGAALGVGYTVRSTLPMLFGDSAGDVIEALDGALPEWTEDSFAGLLMNVAAGRIANRLDLGGTNYTVDAACASALAAVTLAAKDLQSGASDMAIVGGVDAIQTPFAYLCFAKTQALSPSGRCRPFDAGADGIAIAEGFAAVVLKRLADAERDGDRVYAVLRGYGGASDGRDRSLTAPRPEGQMLALERAYAHAGVSPATVGLVEAHGTGTVAGDGAEVRALSTVYARHGAEAGSCAIGSVKSMIGHTKATAGVAGLIKAALALHHKVLPPTLGVTEPNERAGFGTNPFYVNSETRPWVQDVARHPRRAGVSSFGFGGTNFHAVLEEYTGGFLEPASGVADWPAELLLWRGATRGDLQAPVAELLAELEGGARPDLTRVAARLAAKAGAVAPGGPALAIVAGSHDELLERLRAARDLLGGTAERHHGADGVHYADAPLAGPEGVAFLFPGQGSQAVGMGADLVMAFPEALAAFEQADRVLADRLERPLSALVFPPPTFTDEARASAKTELTETDVAQPALGATSLACLAVLRAFGVEPAMAAGHSYGEFVALAAAGSLGADDLLALSEARGRFIKEEAGEDAGTMAAITAPAGAVAPLLGEGVVIANLNGPAQTVVSGTREGIAAVLARCAEAGLSARELPVACAFHSPLVAPAQRRLAARLAETELAAPRIPVFSNTTGAAYPQDPAAARALLADHLVQPVDFLSETEAMYAAGARVFVEVGPRDVLTGLVRRTLGDRPHVAVALDRPGRNGHVELLHALAALVTEGVPVDTARLFRGRPGREPAVPHSRSTWLVNAARAWPASQDQPAWPAPLTWTPPQRENPPMPPPAPLHANGTGNGHAPLPAVLAPAALPVPAPAPGLVAPDGDRAADVMTAYHDVMQRFLETERSVMLAYLTGRAAPEAAPRPRPAAAAPALAPPPVAAVAPPAPLPEPAPAPAPPAPSAAVAPAAAPVAPVTPPAPVPNGNVGLTREELTARLLDVVSERTGYPPDMLGLDADLEADLSIDSIKRVEIAGTIVESLPKRDGVTVDAEQMTASRTLREVLDALEPLIAAPAAPGGGDPRPFVDEPVDHRIGRLVLRATGAPAPAHVARLPEAGAVVIDGAGPVAAALAARLRADGHDVVTDSAVPESVKAFVHAAALDDGEPAPARGLFLRTQALRDAFAPGAVVLGATCMGGTFGVGDRPPAAAPAHGAVAGFLKSLAHERPDLRVTAVDLDDAGADEAAAALHAELTAGDGLLEVGRRGGERTTLALEPAPVEGREDTPPLDRAGVVLATGGARGITAHVALELARRYGPTLVLVGRTPLADEEPELAAVADAVALRRAVLERARAADPTVTPARVEAEHRRLLAVREVRATLAALEAAGARAEYRACDVRDAAAFGALVDDVYATHGRIDGVIHAAGVIEDKLIADKDPASFDRVVTTKVAGAEVLAERLRPDALRFLVFFSSVSARFGNRGQADYAAAGEALNKLAQVLDRRWRARVVSINWGPWLAGGMVSEGVQRQFAARGVALIDIATGCRMLDEELRFGRKGEVEVVIGGTTGHATAGRALLDAGAIVGRRDDGATDVTRTFDLERDPYLADHRLDGRPVLPFAFATELMAEVAAAAGTPAAALTRIRLLHGIRVDDAGAEVRVLATPGPEGTDLEVTSAEEPERRRYRSRALAAPAAGPAPAVPAPLDGLPPFPMTVADAYRDLLFHGPRFQGILSIEGMDERGARATVRATGGGRFWMDPIALDCALQLQVIWARLHWDVTLLPAEIGEVRPLAPLEGEALRLELRIRPASRAPLCHADHYFLAPDGRLLGTLSDVVGTGSRALNRLAGFTVGAPAA